MLVNIVRLWVVLGISVLVGLALLLCLEQTIPMAKQKNAHISDGWSISSDSGTPAALATAAYQLWGAGSFTTSYEIYAFNSRTALL